MFGKIIKHFCTKGGHKLRTVSEYKYMALPDRKAENNMLDHLCTYTEKVKQCRCKEKIKTKIVDIDWINGYSIPSRMADEMYEKGRVRI
jgi:hypothetical protein